MVSVNEMYQRCFGFLMAIGQTVLNWAWCRDLIIYITSERGRITAHVNGDIARLDAASYLDIWAEASLLAKRRNAERMVWALELSSDQQLISEITTPVMSVRRLSAAVAYQLELLYPFSIDQLYYGYRVIERDRHAGQLKVRVVASPKVTVQPLIDRLRSASISIDGICPVDDRGLNMLPVEERASSGMSTKWLSAMAGTAAVLVLVALTLPLWMQTHLADEAEALADTAVTTVMPLLEMRNEVKKDVGDAQAALSAASQVDVRDVLPRIMSGLGEKGGLQRAVYRAGEIQISGATKDAKKLADAIEQNALFEQPLFVTPSIVDQTTGLERFNLKFSVTSGVVQR